MRNMTSGNTGSFQGGRGAAAARTAHTHWEYLSSRAPDDLLVLAGRTPAPAQLPSTEDRPVAIAGAFKDVAGHGPDPVEGLRGVVADRQWEAGQGDVLNGSRSPATM